VRAESEPPVRGAPDTEQCLSGAAPDYPVPLEDKTSNCQKLQNPNSWVTWLAHRTVRCAHRQQPPPTVELVVEGYKYPQPPPLQQSKHSQHLIQYKSKVQHSKTQIKAADPIKVPNSILSALGPVRGSFSCFFVALVAWLAFFLSFLFSKPCKQSKRYQSCGGPCGV
jgi:hypothetical protein